MQRGAIERFQPKGLNSSIKILPQLLNEGGYATHMVSFNVQMVWINSNMHMLYGFV